MNIRGKLKLYEDKTRQQQAGTLGLMINSNYSQISPVIASGGGVVACD